MAITPTGQFGQLARRRVATVPELVHEDVRSPSLRQVGRLVLNLEMILRATRVLKDLVLVSHKNVITNLCYNENSYKINV
jgi:hypothetical protein